MGKFDKVAHRRASKVVKVVDGNGAPVANTKMRLRQTNHEFLFGCGAFDINEYFLTDDSVVKANMQEILLHIIIPDLHDDVLNLHLLILVFLLIKLRFHHMLTMLTVQNSFQLAESILFLYHH